MDKNGDLYFNSLHFLLKRGPLATMYHRSKSSGPLIVLCYFVILTANLAFFALNVAMLSGLVAKRVQIFELSQADVGISVLLFLCATAGPIAIEDIRHLTRHLLFSSVFYAAAIATLLVAFFDVIVFSSSNPILISIACVYAVGLASISWLAYLNLTRKSVLVEPGCTH